MAFNGKHFYYQRKEGEEISRKAPHRKRGADEGGLLLKQPVDVRGERGERKLKGEGKKKKRQPRGKSVVRNRKRETLPEKKRIGPVRGGEVPEGEGRLVFGRKGEKIPVFCEEGGFLLTWKGETHRTGGGVTGGRQI